MTLASNERYVLNEGENVLHKQLLDEVGNVYSQEVDNLDEAVTLRVLAADEEPPADARRCRHCFPDNED